MKRLVDDLLDVSRITSGRVQLQKSQVDAAEIITRVAEANNVLFSSRGHTLHLDMPREEPSLEADPYRLEQILSNLAGQRGQVYRSGRRNLVQLPGGKGQTWYFASRDTGIGIGARLVAECFRFVCSGQSLAAPRGRRAWELA